jgi:cell division protein FtsQ
MTDLVSPSPEELSNRRRALRKQRRIRNLQNIWRVLAIVGLAGGAVWFIQKPFWLTLSRPEQVVIEGNQMLADAAIREVLDLQYPEPLLQIEPETVAQRLQTQSPIAFVQVERRLFPPRLEITLQERQPVAVTIPSRPGTEAADTAEKTPANYPGLVDIEGYWMPHDPSLGLDSKFEVPALRIRGFNRRYQEQWPELYEAMGSSSIQINEVDLRSPGNLILKTELGVVHLGIYDPLRFQEQLSTLPRFRSFTTNPNAPAIDFIDLSNPQMPAVKLSKASNPEMGLP